MCILTKPAGIPSADQLSLHVHRVILRRFVWWCLATRTHFHLFIFPLFPGDNCELSPQRDWLLFSAATIKGMKQVQRTMLQIWQWQPWSLTEGNETQYSHCIFFGCQGWHESVITWRKSWDLTLARSLPYFIFIYDTQRRDQSTFPCNFFYSHLWTSVSVYPTLCLFFLFLFC